VRTGPPAKLAAAFQSPFQFPEVELAKGFEPPTL
jgi:hypothetical protein